MKIKIWGIIEGPTSVSEFNEDYEVPEGSEYFMLCKVEIDGELEADNFWFEDFNDAYEWVKYFSNTAEPLILDMGSDPEYN
jgi:hypothetical protein|tara:strand:+ start:69 stop:311 length:243 start_codon:yes stop_codon:yes gene_type:complete